jgi:predicted ATP-dependent endonuclease of OLD family
MITRISITHFKNLKSATRDLGTTFVPIGLNNSGKTSAFQTTTL